ncbi:hypothetical protein DY000_02008789 [Brassica cretica]|uniref:Copine C-terminal domain-containing protein n=1 Tax=Brassica cretica TaxID=69181 RepID=A0ABQ7BWU8_BRACR|nr:hypothetical protein DY000_02008789 [Brassica cretica]
MNNTTSPKSRRIVSLLLTNSYNGEFFGPSCHLKAGCSNTVEIRLLRFWDNVKKGGELMTATSYALSIVLVSVGDGPWTDMMKFNDKIPKPEFNNL